MTEMMMKVREKSDLVGHVVPLFAAGNGCDNLLLQPVCVCMYVYACVTIHVFRKEMRNEH